MWWGLVGGSGEGHSCCRKHKRKNRVTEWSGNSFSGWSRKRGLKWVLHSSHAQSNVADGYCQEFWNNLHYVWKQKQDAVETVWFCITCATVWRNLEDVVLDKSVTRRERLCSAVWGELHWCREDGASQVLEVRRSRKFSHRMRTESQCHRVEW